MWFIVANLVKYYDLVLSLKQNLFKYLENNQLIDMITTIFILVEYLI